MYTEFIELNNTKQCVAISHKNSANPLLLYLHGGPGDAALPLVLKYNRALQDSYTVAVWEQRGAGKSYYRFSAAEPVSIDIFLNDLHQLVLKLLLRFGKEKLLLIGHSWGSVLGLQFAQRYPRLLSAFVGCGQVVNMVKSSKIAYDFTLNKNIENNNKKIVEKLKSIDCSYRSKTWLSDLLYVTKEVTRQKGSIYAHTNMNKYMFDFLISGYGVRDLLKRQKGSLQSIQFLWQELMKVDFENATEFGVPIVFIEGRHDYHVSSQLAYNYFVHIKTPKEFYWFEKSGHFPQWEEADRFAEILRELSNRI